MAIKQYAYPADSTLDALCESCQIDEDTFRARLLALERTEIDGMKANQATFTLQSIEQSEPHIRKKLSFQDITKSAPDKVPGYDLAFSSEVFLNGKPATIAVYREQ